MDHESKMVEHEKHVPIWKAGEVILAYLPGTFIIIYRWFQLNHVAGVGGILNTYYTIYSYCFNSMYSTCRYILYNKATATEINQVYKSLALAHVTFWVRWQLWEFPKMAPWVPWALKIVGDDHLLPMSKESILFKRVLQRWCPNLIQPHCFVAFGLVKLLWCCTWRQDAVSQYSEHSNNVPKCSLPKEACAFAEVTSTGRTRTSRFRWHDCLPPKVMKHATYQRNAPRTVHKKIQYKDSKLHWNT